MFYFNYKKTPLSITQSALFLFFIAGISFSSSNNIDTTGSGALVNGEYRVALEALKRDSAVTDSVYWHFKQGVAYFNCQDYERALAQLKLCVSDSSQFRGIALEFIGDIETAGRAETMGRVGVVFEYELVKRPGLTYAEQVLIEFRDGNERP